MDNTPPIPHPVVEPTGEPSIVVAAAGGEPPVAARPRLRTAAYCLALAVLAGVLMFWELGADALTGDEAQYALVVQNIRRSGDWVHVTPYPPTAYLQKPPLYFWLTAWTYDSRLLGREELAFRAWSAAAGAGAVVLTCVLGAALFTPEVGAIAGLLLMLNRAFLLVHGARSGTFDALITFFAVAAAAVYAVVVLRARRTTARAQTPALRYSEGPDLLDDRCGPSRVRSDTGVGWARWGGWILIGFLAGLASLTKPFIGVPVVLLLALHAAFADREVSVGKRLVGPLLALVILLVVATPWYMAQWRAYPGDFAEQMIRRNLVERVTEGVDDKHVEDWNYYLEQVSKASLPFFATIPAILYAAVFALRRGPKRWAYGLMAVLAGGWLILFSLSASKAIHYAYPAFPAIAVMIAEGALRLWRALAGARPRVATVLAGGVLVAMTFQYGRTLYAAIPAERSAYVPWEMYQALAPAMRAGDARVIFHGFPALQTDWRSQMGLRARDCYYLEQIRAAGVTNTTGPGDLAGALEQRKPSLIVASGLTDVTGLLADESLRHRTDVRFVYRHQGYAVLGTDLRPLLEPAVRAGEANPYVRIEGDDAQPPGVHRMTLTPAVEGAVRIEARVRVPAEFRDGPVRFTFVMATREGRKTLDDQVAQARDGVAEVSTLIERALREGLEKIDVTLTVRDARSRPPGPVRSTLEVVRLSLLPEIPPERHPRR